REVSELHGRRIATSYPGLVGKHLADLGVADARVVRLDGAVETSVALGVADVIADVVSTGTTLRQAGLEVFGEPILRSEAVLIRRAGGTDTPQVEQLIRRLQGVIVARRYVLMDYDVRAELVEEAIAITPGLESPTVSPLHDRGWVAVRAMVLRPQTNRVMDELWQLGARGILVTEIHACRL
ncbi:MAG: ATP phosphoribosyltransferase, partial [Actinomycetales bacterium]